METGNGNLPILQVILKYVPNPQRMKAITQIVSRLKFIYNGKYNVVVTDSGVEINGSNVTQLIIDKDCNMNEILKALDDRIDTESQEVTA